MTIDTKLDMMVSYLEWLLHKMLEVSEYATKVSKYTCISGKNRTLTRATNKYKLV